MCQYPRPSHDETRNQSRKRGVGGDFVLCLHQWLLPKTNRFYTPLANFSNSLQSFVNIRHAGRPLSGSQATSLRLLRVTSYKKAASKSFAHIKTMKTKLLLCSQLMGLLVSASLKNLSQVCNIKSCYKADYPIQTFPHPLPLRITYWDNYGKGPVPTLLPRSTSQPFKDVTQRHQRALPRSTINQKRSHTTTTSTMNHNPHHPALPRCMNWKVFTDSPFYIPNLGQRGT